MSTYAQLAHDNRNKAIADMRAKLDEVAEEGRDLTPEEVEFVERAEADAEKYGKEAERANRADELAAKAAEFRGTPEPAITPEQKAELIRDGYELARHMSWEAVAERYFLPAIDRVLRRKGTFQRA